MRDRVLQHASARKLAGIKVVYADEVLTIDGYQCSKCETLAIANMLLPDYKALVEQAREEQRQMEAAGDKRKWGHNKPASSV